MNNLCARLSHLRAGGGKLQKSPEMISAEHSYVDPQASHRELWLKLSR